MQGQQTTTGQRTLRFGLAGTGHWARIAHAPALASTDGIEFTAVWGRNQKAAADLPARSPTPATSGSAVTWGASLPMRNASSTRAVGSCMGTP